MLPGNLLILLLLLLAAGCAPVSGVYHTVQEGQTLYRISRTYGVDERYIARVNHIEDPTRLRAGERIFIPGAEGVRSVPVIAQAKASPAPAKKPADRPPAASRSAPASVPVKAKGGTGTTPQAAGKPTAAAPAAPGKAQATKGRFLWPLSGQVIRRYGAAGEPPCKGLEIAAARGTPVLSAAAGRVIYSGDGIRSYGNLVILRHDDDFFTVYGYNEANLVKAGSFVSRGDRIALSGVPPAGGTPRLYFEIRRGKDPVDPIFHLP